MTTPDYATCPGYLLDYRWDYFAAKWVRIYRPAPSDSTADADNDDADETALTDADRYEAEMERRWENRRDYADA